MVPDCQEKHRGKGNMYTERETSETEHREKVNMYI